MGSGSFGTVVQALWRVSADALPKKVAIKFIPETIARESWKTSLDTITTCFIAEAELAATARRDIVSKELLVETFGVVVGDLPRTLWEHFKIANDRCAAIVMRYEAGGTLASRLHSTDEGSVSVSLTRAEKIFIAAQIARGGCSCVSIFVVTFEMHCFRSKVQPFHVLRNGF